MTRHCGIGTIGTARFCGTWPLESIWKIDLKNVTFNELFWFIDEVGKLVVKWMDNRMVFLVSTVHTIMDVAYCLQRQPRVIPLNKGHVNDVWGNLVKSVTYFILFYTIIYRSNIFYIALLSQQVKYGFGYLILLMITTIGWEELIMQFK